jgi:hypothetical protein
MAKERNAADVKPGDTVRVVLHNGKHADAVVDRVNKKEGVCLSFTYEDAQRKEEFEIAASPFDPDGKKPDSWHFPEAASEEVKPQA